MRNLTYSIVLLLIFVFSSCSDRARISRQYVEFTSNNIVFPSAFQKVESGQVGISDACPDIPIMILYNDSLSCSLCQINHLHDRIPIYEHADSLGTYMVMTILSPKPEEYNDVILALQVREFDFPVYVDYSGDFGRLNKCIPEDPRFHCFLINRERKPVFVGDPLASTTLWDLFCKVLDNIEIKEENE